MQHCASRKTAEPRQFWFFLRFISISNQIAISNRIPVESYAFKSNILVVIPNSRNWFDRNLNRITICICPSLTIIGRLLVTSTCHAVMIRTLTVWRCHLAASLRLRTELRMRRTVVASPTLTLIPTLTSTDVSDDVSFRWRHRASVVA